MVPIHSSPITVYLIIRVKCFIFRFKRGNIAHEEIIYILLDHMLYVQCG